MYTFVLPPTQPLVRPSQRAWCILDVVSFRSHPSLFLLSHAGTDLRRGAGRSIHLRRRSDDTVCSASNARPQLCAFLGDGSGDGRSFHLAFRIDDDACVVFEVHVQPFLSPPRLALADHHGRHHCAFFLFACPSVSYAVARVLTRDSFASSRGCPSVRFVGEVFARTFLSQVGLSFLDTGHHHVSCCSCWESVQPRSPSDHGDHVQVLGTGVVGAVHHRTHRQRQRHAELVARSTSSSCTSSSATVALLPLRHARVARHLAPRFDIVADDAHVRAEWRRRPPMGSSTPLPIRVAPCSWLGRSPKGGHTNARREATLGGEADGERSERKGRNGREPDEEGRVVT